MAEYLAPGVYVEEVSFRAPSIEGVGTTTTAFAGPTLTGPVGGMPYGGMPSSGAAVAGAPGGGVPQLLTSFGDFQNIYGGFANLDISSSAAVKNVNYMALAVQSFFMNRGSMLYVSRVFNNNAIPASGTTPAGVDPGVASATKSGVTVAGRFPGAFLNNSTVTIALVATRVLNFNNLANLPNGSLLGTPGTTPAFYTNGTGTVFNSVATTPVPLTASTMPAKLYLLTLQVSAPSAAGQQMVFTSLGLDPNHPNYVARTLGVNPPRPIDALQNQISVALASTITSAAGLFGALFAAWSDPGTTPPPAVPVASFTLAGGNDGAEPVTANYQTALQYVEPLEDVAIVGTPGASVYTDTGIMSGALLPHVERQRAYRVAILESGPGLLDSDYENLRAQIDSSYAALYVPWVYTPNPLAVGGSSAPSQILVPPTGMMAGVYARSDVDTSVAKAPANEVLLGALDLERHISFGEQAVLNPLGINCLRFFPDRGYRVWGARTVSSDSELKYINVRRYLVYLEHSIDNGTQWAVFENNGPALWARVTDSIESFLDNEFASGNLLGSSPSQAYFVRCDRTTMTQNDLDNGILICLIGVALLKPAEFVVFRIGQMTASART